MGNKHILTVPGRYEKVQQVCQFMAQGAMQAGLGETAVFHIELACDEACTNIIEHAYGGEGVGDIEVSWEIVGSRFVITIHDHGRAFDPAQVPTPDTLSDLYTSETDLVENLRVGGLGIHFMRKLMDDVRFHFDAQGNTLTLIKNIPAE
jgi:serine/threonine-protein kinase RsbW